MTKVACLKLRFLAVLVVAGALTGLCPLAASAAGTQLLIGADTTFPPFEMMKDGHVIGFDIDMLKHIAKLEGFTYTIKPMPFEGLIPSLQSGAINAAVAGMSITKPRTKHVDFSDAYYRSGLSVLVRKGSPIKGFADLKGHVIGTKKGTSSMAYLRDHKVDMQNIKQFANISSAYAALENGSVDAVFFDNPSNAYFKSTHGGVQIVGSLKNGQYYGFAISKKNPELVKKFNDGIKKLRANGYYASLFDKYFSGDRHGEVKKVIDPLSVAVSGND